MKKKLMILCTALLLVFIGVTSVQAKEIDCSKENLSKAKCKACGFVYNKKYKFCSNTGVVYVACGFKSGKINYDAICENNKAAVGTGAYDIPPIIPDITSFAVNALKIVTPVILIFMGMITMVKAIASSNEDEIKKAQNGLVKKIIIAVMVFFVIGITQFVIAKVSDSASESVDNCLDVFLNGNYDTVYYRTGSGGNKCVPVKRKD